MRTRINIEKVTKLIEGSPSEWIEAIDELIRTEFLIERNGALFPGRKYRQLRHHAEIIGFVNAAIRG